MSSVHICELLEGLSSVHICELLEGVSSVHKSVKFS